jgi:hypothetical protein
MAHVQPVVARVSTLERRIPARPKSPFTPNSQHLHNFVRSCECTLSIAVTSLVCRCNDIGVRLCCSEAKREGERDEKDCEIKATWAVGAGCSGASGCGCPGPGGPSELKQAELTRDTDPAALAAARATLLSAQADLARLVAPPAEGEVLAARENLDSAQETLARLLAGPDSEQVAIAQANLTLAEINLRAAQAAYDKVAPVTERRVGGRDVGGEVGGREMGMQGTNPTSVGAAVAPGPGIARKETTAKERHVCTRPATVLYSVDRNDGRRRHTCEGSD